MSSRLDKDQIEDLIEYCYSTPTRWRGDNMQICCPIHGESNPSMGVSEEKQVCHCFSCGFSGSFAWLLYNARQEDFKSFREAQKFLKERYELEYVDLYDKPVKNIKRYEDLKENVQEETRNVLPMYKIAPFMCGKETYQYFYNRGFDKEDLKKFKIGRDVDERTVVIPAFYEDNQLAGMIGRYIDKRKKNERYRIYNFPRGDILYPLNYFEPVNNTAIIVEGMFDAMRFHKLGYENTVAKMGVNITSKQAEILAGRCNKIIYLCDNDERGLEAREKDIKEYKDLFDFLIVDYPSKGKDVCEMKGGEFVWGEKEVDRMIRNAHSSYRKRIMRL